MDAGVPAILAGLPSMLRSTFIALVMLIVVLTVTACGARDELRSTTCRTHKAGAGELTECE
jgi:hypothetical protein